MKNRSMPAEFLELMIIRKDWWFILIIFMLLLAGIFMILVQSESISPFTYPLF